MDYLFKYIIEWIFFAITVLVMFIIRLIVEKYCYAKPKKVTRSQKAFESVAKKQCICDNPCNEFCRK